jgi:hypothetical protein
MTKSEQITEKILGYVNDPMVNPYEMIEMAIRTAMMESFSEGCTDGKTMFNPNVQAFEVAHPSFKAWNKIQYEYPGFQF